MSELLIAERQDLQDIANKLKAKIGKTDGMSFPNGFKEAIDNISGEPKLQDKTITENGTYQADSGYDGLGSVTVEVASSLEGLENGYDVMFYDENNEGLAFYSIKQGHSINPPVYDCKEWKTEDGIVVSFPLTPTENVIVYANNESLDNVLYDFYNVDKALYPYVVIAVQNYNNGASGGRDTIRLYFTDKVSGSTVMKPLYGEVRDRTNVSALDLTDINAVMSMTINLIKTVSKNSNNTMLNTAYGFYTNFETDLTGTKATGRLDV